MATELQPLFERAIHGLQGIDLLMATGIGPAAWQPDPELEEHPRVPDAPYEEGWLDLATLEQSKAVNVLLTGADYTIKKMDDDHVKLWCSRGGTHNRWLPFVGRTSAIGVVVVSHEVPNGPMLNFYPGIIATRTSAVRTSMEMPYFAYDSEGRLLPTNQSDGSWIGDVLGIRLYDFD